MSEIWKDIYFVENGVEYDYRGFYQVSNKGNVRSLSRLDGRGHLIKEKILKQTKNFDYLTVRLYKNNNSKFFKVHRLVAHMFVDGYFDGAEVDHIIPIKNGGNNNVNNLKWVTPKENSNNELTKNNKSNAHKGKQTWHGSLIERWDLNGNLIDIKYQYEYVKIGFASGSITNCCKDRQKSHKGFIFKYH